MPKAYGAPPALKPLLTFDTQARNIFVIRRMAYKSTMRKGQNRMAAVRSAACEAECRPKGNARPAIDAEELATLFKALGHPARVEILRHLSRHGTCYFGSLSDVVGLAPSTTSEHVKILKEAGLVIGSAEEQRTCYCVNPKRLALLKQLVEGL